MASIYPRLFRAYIEQFNWGYRDRYEDGPLRQSVQLGPNNFEYAPAPFPVIQVKPNSLISRADAF